MTRAALRDSLTCGYSFVLSALVTFTALFMVVGLVGCSGGARFAEGARWPSRTITYSIAQSGTATDIDLRPISVRPLAPVEVDAYHEAIGKWAAVGAVRLVEDNTAPWPGAQVIIYGVESLPGGAVGEALPHVDQQTGNLDRVRILVPPPTKGERERRLAALHEVGHALSLDHTHEARAVMHPRWFLLSLVEVTRWDAERLRGAFEGVAS